MHIVWTALMRYAHVDCARFLIASQRCVNRSRFDACAIVAKIVIAIGAFVFNPSDITIDGVVALILHHGDTARDPLFDESLCIQFECDITIAHGITIACSQSQCFATIFNSW